MSSSEGDIDDELLELAGATEKKRKRSQQNTSSKRRKADAEDEAMSEQAHTEDEESAETNPYPLEGKFIDEADREELLGMPEVEREAILAQRQEEMQRFADKRQLDLMLMTRGGREGAEESVSKAAKRQHAVRGATKEKSKKLDELKARRKAKDEKKRTRGNSPKRDRSSSPMDMETSDEEEEDGQITKYDEEEERDRRLFSKTIPEDEGPITFEDLAKCQITRTHIAKFCMAPWFSDFVKGGWVRYLIGNEGNEAIYRLCEVSDISQSNVKPYKVDDQLVNQELDLKYGESIRNLPMDKISNGKFTSQEYERLVKVCENDKTKLPTKRQIEKKAAQLQKYISQPFTESDIAAMLARKQAISSANANRTSHASLTMERARLNQARTLALRRMDHSEVAAIDAKIAEIDASMPSRDSRGEESSADVLAKLNERNRRLNQEQVRKAQRAEMERKRRERLLRAGSAPGTPGVGDSTPRSVSPAGTPGAQTKNGTSNGRNFEASVLESVEIDLGDF